MGATLKGIHYIVVPLARTASALATCALAVSALGCASGGADVVAPALPRGISSYLVDPSLEPGLDAAAARRLRLGFESLIARADIAAAAGEAQRLLEVNPSLEPARLLAAQAEFASGDVEAAYQTLASSIGDAGASAALRLLLGRTAELGGHYVVAHEAYRSLDDGPGPGSTGAVATYELALEQVEHDLAADLDAGRVDRAAAGLARLRGWEPMGSLRTLDAERRLARARGELDAELDALRGLVGGGRNQRVFVERRAELEMELGDPELGLETFERLLDSHPGDLELAERVVSARVRWRLRLLPEDVQAVSAAAELTRADFAALLFWLVPGVRQGGGGDARIATDVLDHARRGEIVRVLNRGLMQIDDRRHEFGPDRIMQRAEAIRALLSTLRLNGDECARESAAADCDSAVACEILADLGQCHGDSSLTGSGAVTLLGRTLNRLGRD
ncbi:MAG: hypothetical protein VYE73_01640 [Acidobacteriota bacterium]|nr:hypothetical protein [Acidobacteriota bacterium]